MSRYSGILKLQMVQSSTYTACVFLHNVIMLSTLGNYSLWPVASGQTVFCLRCDSRISTNLLPSETEVHSYHTSWQTQHLICLLSLLSKNFHPLPSQEAPSGRSANQHFAFRVIIKQSKNYAKWRHMRRPPMRAPSSG